MRQIATFVKMGMEVGWEAGRRWFTKDGNSVSQKKRNGYFFQHLQKRQLADLIYKLLLMANKWCGCLFAYKDNENRMDLANIATPQTKSELSCFYSLNGTHMLS